MLGVDIKLSNIKKKKTAHEQRLKVVKEKQSIIEPGMYLIIL